MPTRKPRHALTLLASTSLLALSLTAAPIQMDFQLDKPLLKIAQAKSCFVAGTRVLMADGTRKAIESLRVGDHVMGRAGQANRVLGIEAPLLEARRLYAFNGGRAFVTAEHPFATPAGWKAVDPAATRFETASLRVGALTVGDLVARARPDAPTRSEGAAAVAAEPGLSLGYEVIEALEAHEADPATVVYNLLLDGDHTYFADGYLVHNKGEGGEGGGEGGGSGSGGSDGGSEGGESGGSGGSDGGSEGGESGGSGGSGGGSEGGESGGSGSGGEGGESDGSGGEGGESGDASGSEAGEAGDDNGRDGLGHDVGDDHGVDGVGHDVGDDNGIDDSQQAGSS